MPAKKNDPNYNQFSAYFPRDLLEEFREECKRQKLDYSDGAEIAFRNWLNSPDRRTTPFLERMLQLLLSGTRPKAAEIVEFAALLGVETEEILPIFLAPIIGKFLVNLCKKERPDNSKTVAIAHDLGLDSAELLEVVALCTIQKENGEINNGGRNGS
ncbi:MAG: hypothetical protein J7647_16130 [Cyanobacteria bacterium SBLK]|nr:hypothetical protein [Cyanobacteria bacterium SBLK]